MSYASKQHAVLDTYIPTTHLGALIIDFFNATTGWIAALLIVTLIDQLLSQLHNVSIARVALGIIAFAVLVLVIVTCFHRLNYENNTIAQAVLRILLILPLLYIIYVASRWKDALTHYYLLCHFAFVIVLLVIMFACDLYVAHALYRWKSTSHHSS